MSLPADVGVRGLDLPRLRASVADRFRPGSPDLRVGVEVEAIPVDAATRRPVPPEDRSGGRALVPLLRVHARERGWQEGRNYAGAPAFTTGRGGTLSFEPGGQLEYASPPERSLGALDDDLAGVLEPLARALAGEGVMLLARGVDPRTPLDEARLHLAGERYTRMAAHYARRGPWGRRMMRQTAALHINVDAPGPPFEAWRAASAAAPALLAAFANSAVVEGHPSGHRSARAAQWRSLDPGRTGLVATSADPVSDYLDFALGADAFLLGGEGIPARPFREWMAHATPGDWERHLSTLFPEVRPRRYLEFRSVDALPLRWVLVPTAILVGLLFDPTARGAAADLPPVTGGFLERAGRCGLADAGVADRVRTVLDLAEEGLAALDETVAPRAIRERVSAFRSAWTDQGRDPASGALDGLV